MLRLQCCCDLTQHLPLLSDTSEILYNGEPQRVMRCNALPYATAAITRLTHVAFHTHFAQSHAKNDGMSRLLQSRLKFVRREGNNTIHILHCAVPLDSRSHTTSYETSITRRTCNSSRCRTFVARHYVVRQTLVSGVVWKDCGAARFMPPSRGSFPDFQAASPLSFQVSNLTL
jgi:hypothetical protein